jgi:hypothetical protein
MIDIQSRMKELFGNSCCAYCYASLASRNNSDIKALTYLVLEGWYHGYIDDDGFVSKPVQYWNSMGVGHPIKDIVNIPIRDLSELPDGYWVVEYKLTPDSKASHFVVASHDCIVFDPAGDSKTVRRGRPVSYRKLVPDSSGDWVVRDKEPL